MLDNLDRRVGEKKERMLKASTIPVTERGEPVVKEETVDCADIEDCESFV